jgi:acyl-CoA thioesterase-2
MAEFEHDTRVEGERGRYRAMISPDWEVWGPNGGYVAAIVLRAAAAEARIRRPVAFAGHYLSVARFAPVDLAVEVAHRGRSSESIRVSMTQAGKPIVEAIVRTAIEAPGLSHDEAELSDVPGPDGLQSADEIRAGSPTYPFWHNLESRPLDPDLWKDGRPSRAAAVRQWYRFRPIARFDEPFLDAARALVLIDTLVWAASCQRHVDPAFMAPNLDVVAWFHRTRHASEWLLGDAVAPIAEGGLVGGNVRIWSEDRRLLASGGAQLLCLPGAPPEPRAVRQAATDLKAECESPGARTRS